MGPFPAPITITEVRRSRGGAGRSAPRVDEMSDVDLVSLLIGSAADAAAILAEVGGLPGLAQDGHGRLADLAPPIPRAARRLGAALELARRMAEAGCRPGWRIRSPADVGERLRPAMRHLEQEELRTLLLNTKNVVVGARTVYVGNLAGSSVRVGEVFRDAVRSQAAAVVVVHNHPSGDPTPSADDLHISAELAQAGRLLDIELLDHVVVGAEGWVSIRALGGL
ncbi:MAG TPA: JAB domain-containing protein [Candidatus Limnocylindria bacterium]|nr:JAB domain-containing protein [Candidatus Limnocylindria bacterium]